MSNLLEMEKEQRIQFVISDFEEAMSKQKPLFDKFKAYYNMYRQHVEESDMRPNGANLFIPYAFSTIESIIPKVIQAMFNSRPYISILPVGQNDYENSKSVEKLLDYQMENKIKPIGFFTRVVRNTLMYGTAITKQTWKTETTQVSVKKKVDGKLKDLPKVTKIEKETVTIYDAPFLQLIPLEDFFFDQTAHDIDECRFVIHRYYEDLDTVKEKIDSGVYNPVSKDDMDKLKGEESTDPHSAFGRMNDVKGTTVANKDKVEILEYWGNDGVVKIGNRSVELAAEENPFFHGKKPFVRWVDYDLENEFYGIGEIEIMQDLQLELNTTRNQRMDNVNVILNKMFMYKRDMGINPADLVSRPGGLIPVEDMEDIKAIDFPDVTQSAYNEEESIKGDIDRVTGINDYARGSDPSRKETATTVSILSESAGERITLKIKQFEETSMREVGLQLVALNQQFLEENTQIRILDEYERPVNEGIGPYDIAGSFDVMATGSSTQPVTNKEARQNQLVQLWGMVAEDPNINKAELLKALFESYEFKNIDKLIVEQQQPPVDPAAMQDPNMMQQQADPSMMQQPQVPPQM